MKKKYYLVAILLMLVGFATVSTTLYLNGSTSIISNDDFKVYYSDAKVNGVQDLSIVDDDTHLSFTTELDTLGQTYVIEYDVTNSSKSYDADLEMVCTGGDEYLSVNNVFDDVTNLPATETRVGTLTLTLAKTYTGADYDVNIDCTITAKAVERTSLGSGDISSPVQPVKGYQIGDEIAIADEKFNVIEITDETLTLYAQKGLNSSYRQSDSPELMQLHTGWTAYDEDEDGNIILDSVNSDVKTYVANYVEYLKTETGDSNLTGSIAALNQLISLGCEVDETQGTCDNSKYTEWLYNGQVSWIRTRHATVSNWVYILEDYVIGGIEYDGYFDEFDVYTEEKNAVRPTITISIEKLEEYLLSDESQVLDAQTFCENKGYAYGIEYVQTYAEGYNNGNIEDSHYLCSDYEDFDVEVYGYDINGELVYEYWDGTY